MWRIRSADPVNLLVASDEALFYSTTKSIVKRNFSGLLESERSLEKRRGKSASTDNFFEGFKLTPLNSYHVPKELVLWKGTVFVACGDQLLQYGSTPLWSTSMHYAQHPSIKEGITTMLMIVRRDYYLQQVFAKDILFFIFKLYSHQDEEIPSSLPLAL